MAAFNKFNIFPQNVTNGVYNFGADTIKIGLTNTAPVATNTQWSNITEISAGNGYTAGGVSLTLVSNTQSNGVDIYIASAASPTWTATGSVGPFRYCVAYDSTASGSPLVGWWDYGSSITLASGNTFTIVLDGTNGVFQLS